MSDKLAILQTEESIKEIRKLRAELPGLISDVNNLTTSVNKFNRNLRSNDLQRYAAEMQNITAISRQFNDIQRRVSAEMERLSRIEANNARTAAENARARRETASAVREESRTRQQLAREQRQNANESNNESSAYKRLQKEVRETRLRARDYGAEIIALEQKYRQGQISSRDYNTQISELKKNFRLSTNEAIRLERELRRLNQSTLPANQRNGALSGRVTDIIKGLGIFSLAQSALSSLTNAAQKLGVEFYNTAVKLETLRFAQKAVFKTNEEVKNQNIFLTEIASKYGLEILSLTDSYTKFSASSQGTTLEGEKTKEIFDAVTKSSAMLGVTTDDTNGILRALGQMISKGKVQAEELRGQLGDRMAGAFRLFADGMGVSTAELDKMLKDGKVITEEVLPKFAAQLNKKYQLGFGEEIDTKQASLARLKNEWVDFVDAVESKTGIVSGGINAVSNSIVSLLQAIKPSKEVTAIEQEQQQMLVLGIQLRQNWADQDKRREIIEKLISLNPLLLDGLDKEKATLEDISKRIQDVNAQYVQKIILQEKEEQIAELVKDQATAYRYLSEVLVENSKRYYTLNESSKKAIDDYSAGAISFQKATSIVDKAYKNAVTNKDVTAHNSALNILGKLRDVYQENKISSDGYVRSINNGASAIKTATGEYNNLVLVTNKLFGVQGQLLNMNGLLAKSFNSTGDMTINTRKQFNELAKVAEASGKKFVLFHNVWREMDKTGKWFTTNKKQTDGWYEENGNLVLRKPPTLPEKETKPKAASLTAAEKDFVNKATGVRDAELAALKEKKLDLIVNEEDYWKEYEKIYQRFNEKIQAYIKASNAKQIQVEGSVYRKAIDAREQATKELYDRRSTRIEAQNKMELNSLERHSKDLEKADFLTDSEKLQKQIDIDNQMLGIANDYYEKQINLAKRSAQPVIEWERKRDEEIGKIQDARSEKFRSKIEAYTKDLERQASISTSESNISFEEQRRLILTDKRLSSEEKSYRISLLDIDKQIESNKIEIEKLKTLKAQYDLKLSMSMLEGKNNPEAQKMSKDLQDQISTLENANIELNNDAKDSISQRTQAIRDTIAKGFGDLGFNGFADAYSATMQRLKNDTASWKDYAVLAASAVLDSLTKLNNQQKERTIANLDEQLKHSQETTEQEIGFINQRLEYLNGLDELSKEQLSERNRLEDEARTYKEQQFQREKLIEAQKAKAEQRASAQQALINGALAATMTLAQMGFVAGAIPAALALAFGVAQSIAISSRNPVPQYWKGRLNGPEEWADTQEKGREIITNNAGDVINQGSTSGTKRTWLNKGDRVFTADQSKKIIEDFGGIPKLGQNIFRRAAMRSLKAPSFTMINQNNNIHIDENKLADAISKKYEAIFKRNSNPDIQYINGKIIQFHGSDNPIIRGEYDLKTGEEKWYQ